MRRGLAWVLLAAALSGSVLVLPGPGPTVTAAVLAQATDTPTPTPTNTLTPTITPTPTNTPTPTPTATPTLPPIHDFGAGWGVQALPRAGVNCIYETGLARGVFFSCVSGTPVP